jgi:glycosyltransferase involved in cell wall biosynthesis
MSECADPNAYADTAEITTVKLGPPSGRIAQLLTGRKYDSAAAYALILETVMRRAKEVRAAASSFRCSVLIGCSGSPHDLTATALAARRLGVPFIAYLFDDAIGQWPEGPLRTAAKMLSRIWGPIADLILAPNEFVASTWSKRGFQCVVIRNPVSDELEALTAGPARDLGNQAGALPIVYTGSVYHAQADAFHNVIAALERLQGQFHLHVFTNQPAGWVETCGVRGPFVTRHDPVPQSEIPGVLSAASVLLLPLGFNTGIPEAIRTASPGKFGEYLSAERPMLAHVPPDSYIASFCREKDCALLVDRPEPDALVQALQALQAGGQDIERLKANARAASREFKISEVRQKFWSVLTEVAA